MLVGFLFPLGPPESADVQLNLGIFLIQSDSVLLGLFALAERLVSGIFLILGDTT